VNGFWPVEELAEVADGPTGCGEIARGGCSFAWNFSVTRSTVLTEAERGCRCVNDSLLAHGLKNSTGQKPCTALYSVKHSPIYVRCAQYSSLRYFLKV
jgi:hypothetical protein